MSTAKKGSETLTLEYLHKYMAMIVGDEQLITAKDFRANAQYRIEYLGQQVVADWKDLAHRLHEDKYTAYFYWDTPKTTWQMFKERHTPDWFKRRYPIKYQHHKAKRTVRFTRYATYPLANLSIPKNSKLFVEQLGGVERLEDKVN